MALRRLTGCNLIDMLFVKFGLLPALQLAVLNIDLAGLGVCSNVLLQLGNLYNGSLVKTISKKNNVNIWPWRLEIAKV